uniref:SH2 domain-containing protein n=1 Tax=Trichuris muris TaxID=70415 RepID=A0A5S6R1U1_TRIMR
MDMCDHPGEVPHRGNRTQYPWTELPFFHGLISLPKLVGRLKVDGDFLLFANSDALCTPTLAVRAKSFNVTAVVLKQGAGDYLFIQNDDIAMKCTTIGALINCYMKFKIPIKLDNDEWTFLRFPVPNEMLHEHLLLEPSNVISEWSYFHGTSLSPAACQALLNQNGDYLLTGHPDKSDSLTFHVFWANRVHQVNFAQDAPVGFYKILCDESYTPVETVPSLDYLVKSLARSQAAKNSYQFIRPVKRADIKDDQDKESFAPLPLCLLPFYHGKLTGRAASALTVNAGDYLVYKGEGDQLKLVVKQTGKQESFYYHYHIRKDDDNFFFIRWCDRKGRYGTINELIQHYTERNITLGGNRDCDGNLHSVTLRNPVNKARVPMTEEAYDHGEIDRVTTFLRLNQSGDFLIRTVPSTGAKVVSVLWNDDLVDLRVKEPNGEKYYLPRYQDTQLVEWVTTLQEFLEIAVSCGLQLGDICLKRAIAPE